MFSFSKGPERPLQYPITKILLFRKYANCFPLEKVGYRVFGRPLYEPPRYVPGSFFQSSILNYKRI